MSLKRSAAHKNRFKLLVSIKMHNSIIINAGGGLETAHSSDDILEFDAEQGVWNKIGSMSIKRSNHAVSVINYEAMKAFCN